MQKSYLNRNQSNHGKQPTNHSRLVSSYPKPHAHTEIRTFIAEENSTQIKNKVHTPFPTTKINRVGKQNIESGGRRKPL